ncbi:MAG: hypothetical protein MAG795_01152 [Candidatus Woesearchaeota archaeon]|nr:hypothetical protein [Candidatus Woesearchaeota archaeon]
MGELKKCLTGLVEKNMGSNLESKLTPHNIRRLAMTILFGINIYVGSIILPPLINQAKYLNKCDPVCQSFDPSLGQKINSENGRALIVVHEGFVLEHSPEKYGEDQLYLDYLNNLNQLEQQYLDNGDIIVYVVSNSISNQENLDPSTNTMYLISGNQNGFVDQFVLQDEILYSQDVEILLNELNSADVRNIEIAGEKRKSCVAHVAPLFEKAGFEMEYSDSALYPTADMLSK